MPDGSGQPTAEELVELQRQMDDAISQMGVEGALAQSVSQLSRLAWLSLGLEPGGEGYRDLDKARDAIDTMASYVPLLQPRIPPAALSEVRQMIAELQLAFAQVSARCVAPDAGDAPAAEAPPEEPPQSDRPPIWTPRGEV